MKGCRAFERAVFAVNFHLAWLGYPTRMWAWMSKYQVLTPLFHWMIRIHRSRAPYWNTPSRIELRNQSTFNFRSTSPI